MNVNYLSALAHYLPELIIVLTMMSLLIVEATYSKKDNCKMYTQVTTYIGLVAALGALFANQHYSGPLFTNAVVIDPFSTILKMIMVVGTLGCVHLAKISNDIYTEFKTEFSVMALGVLAGAMLLASANNMLTLYLGIEILSILSYVMAAMKKRDDKSVEAGLKYAIYGGVAAGIMLFGMSHIYGTLGTISFPEMAKQFSTMPKENMWILIPSFMVFFVGIGYKISTVPFHMWSPDVYEGSPIPVTTFFAIVPKLAGLAATVRVTQVLFSQPGYLQYTWIGFLTVLAALTMTVGNISAINQKSIKRMLAYSSIAHAGTILLGVLVINEVGTRAVVFYGLSYVFMTLIAFYVTSYISNQYDNDNFERFDGLVKKHPFAAMVMALAMFSLAGIPPFAGFVAKYNIITAIIEKKYYSLAIIAVLNSVVSIVYYLKVVRAMMFKNPENEEKIEGLGFLSTGLIWIFAIPVIFMGVFWDKIIMVAGNAKLFLTALN